jgi:hypothetical protein
MFGFGAIACARTLRVELDYAQWLRIACRGLCGLMNLDCALADLVHLRTTGRRRIALALLSNFAPLKLRT